MTKNLITSSQYKTMTRFYCSKSHKRYGKYFGNKKDLEELRREVDSIKRINSLLELHLNCLTYKPSIKKTTRKNNHVLGLNFYPIPLNSKKLFSKNLEITPGKTETKETFEIISEECTNLSKTLPATRVNPYIPTKYNTWNNNKSNPFGSTLTRNKLLNPSCLSGEKSDESDEEYNDKSLPTRNSTIKRKFHTFRHPKTNF